MKLYMLLSILIIGSLNCMNPNQSKHYSWKFLNYYPIAKEEYDGFEERDESEEYDGSEEYDESEETPKKTPVLIPIPIRPHVIERQQSFGMGEHSAFYNKTMLSINDKQAKRQNIMTLAILMAQLSTSLEKNLSHADIEEILFSEAVSPHIGTYAPILTHIVKNLQNDLTIDNRTTVDSIFEFLLRELPFTEEKYFKSIKSRTRTDRYIKEIVNIIIRFNNRISLK